MSENEKEQMTRREFEEQIITKAQSDKDFKKALVDNPKAALSQLGVQLPEDVEVKVVEESPKVVYLVLPVNLDELTDEQLSNVVGAGWVWSECNGERYGTCDDYNDCLLCSARCDAHNTMCWHPYALQMQYHRMHGC